MASKKVLNKIKKLIIYIKHVAPLPTTMVREEFSQDQLDVDMNDITKWLENKRGEQEYERKIR
jgi:hypothetical protein